MKNIIWKRPLCFLCLLFTGIIFALLCVKGLPEPELPVAAGETALITGKVAGKEYKNDHQVLYLKNVSFSDGQEIQKEEQGNTKTGDEETGYTIGAICYLSDEEDLAEIPVGCHVRLSGEMQLFSSATNPGEFDLKKYYKTQGYYFKLKSAVLSGKSQEYDRWRNGLWELKQYLGSVLDRILNASDAAILKAMLLGDKTQLDSDIKNLYRSSGISHILAISGLHISILGMGLYKLLKKLRMPRPACALVTLFFLLNYAVLTGGGTSTIRAVVMFLYYLLADLLHRTNDPATSLSLSALIVMLVSPYYLFSSGFWLSYMAVAGITIFVPAFLWRESSGHLTKGQKAAKKCLDTLLSGIGLSYFTLPVTLYYFYEYPLYSILLNLLVIPLMTVLMTFALAALLAGCVWQSAGIVLAYPCHFILALYEWLCGKVQSLPFSTLILGCPALWRILLYYIAPAVIIVITGKRKRGERIFPAKKAGSTFLPAGLRKGWLKKLKARSCLQAEKGGVRKTKVLAFLKKYGIWKVLLMACSVALLLLRLPSGLKITMLDVGQGDGLCIEDPYGSVVMIDGGSTSKSSLATYQLLPFLKYEGISEISYWILTHPDQDHISGLLEILGTEEMSGIRIGQILIPDASVSDGEWSELEVLAGAQGIAVRRFRAGESIQDKEFGVECLSPAQGLKTDEANELSVVCEVKYRSFSMLCTGDATQRIEEMIAQTEREEGQDTVRILKVGHHGSYTATGERLLDWYQPQLALISCGYQNRYGHPHAETVERLETYGTQICRTDELGAIEIRFSQGACRVSGFLQE